jgi:glyoxylase-like metal-dependent hydrolase (beta-lactamase superfamily II)
MTSSIVNRPDVVGLFDPGTPTVTYLVSDPETGAAAVIDPVLDYDRFRPEPRRDRLMGA